ncbi:hypothetical protein SAMN05216556_101199 [Aequorivita viscosa]|uniref:Outer membrane protein beta-barrel domain-containing protein n=2 Tax=Aequorivita viscosa TaxID=797419 RepID=A0A1M6EQV9_9FLAO|nr:hypothetical protein SAMN05216556_101199 [Aequorivita viscosa]SHI87670.1 hypothetical protein SAMN04487908_106128 [Aequorivita viscosa]
MLNRFLSLRLNENQMKLNSTKILSVVFFCVLNWGAYAQNEVTTRYNAHNKGKVFLSWGGNRAAYTKSDITFKGDDYNFTLQNVKAHDRPKGWHIDYVNPKRVTISQTNFKLGYFISDKYYLAFGFDHMKYDMTQDQYVNINGYINLSEDEAGAGYNGVYNNESIQLTKDFLEYEHTDGLNYVYLEFGRFDDISSLFRITNIDKIQVNITEGIGIGGLYPKTNTTLLSKDRYDEFHVAGFGVSLSAGVNVKFFKYFFVQGDLKGGYINMPDVRTTMNSSDKASQDFMFFESVFSLGGIFKI